MRNEMWETSIYADDKPRINLIELLQYRDLIAQFVRRTFVAKYKQTVLGPAWAVIQPFLTTVVYSVFFGSIAGLGASGVPNFIFYLTGTVLWTLFANCITQTSESILSNYSILSKVYFPRLTVPISTVISQFIPFLIQYIFMIVFWLFYLLVGVGLMPNLFILLTPIMIAQVALLGLGSGLIAASITVKYRDLSMVLSFGVTLLSYVAPVAYDMFSRSSIAPNGKFYYVYMLNPFTPVLNMFRYAYLGIGEIDWIFYGVGWISTLIILFIGFKLFCKIEKTFMDVL